MNWYYVQNGERQGPVQELELESLLQQGRIDSSTLVWHESMANWQPYGEVSGASNPVATAVAAPPMGLSLAGSSCTRCGRAFPLDELIHIGGANVCPDCKPLALQSLREGVLHQDSNAEQIRKEHIGHEASVRSIGLLYFMGGGFLILGGFGLAMDSAGGGRTLMGLVFIALAILVIWVGTGLRKLRSWARVGSGVLAGIGLLGFPLGTLINAYILYLLFSRKGTMVFSEPYQRIITATPHIKYKTSVLVWILLGILLLFFGLAIVAVIMGAGRGR